MHIKKIIFLTILVICFLPINVFAFCPSNTLQKYRGYARDVKIKYSLINDDIEGGNYRITFSNMNYNIYAKDKNTGAIYKRIDEYNDDEIVKNDILYQGGVSYTIDYYTIDEMCPKDIIYTINLNIPKHNIYYNTDICDDVINYEYCDEYVFTKISNQEIENKIKYYRKVHELDVIIKEEEKINPIIIIGCSSAFVIAIIVVIIVLVKRKRKKDLEWD